MNLRSIASVPMSAPATLAAARSPQRNDWPFTSDPRPAMTAAEYKAALAAIPDRTRPASSLVRDTPKQALMWVSQVLSGVNWLGVQMQRGVAKDPKGFAFNASQLEHSARLAANNLAAWIRPSFQKAHVIFKLTEGAAGVSHMAQRFAFPNEVQGRVDARNLAMAANDLWFAATEAVKMLQNDDLIRIRPMA